MIGRIRLEVCPNLVGGSHDSKFLSRMIIPHFVTVGPVTLGTSGRKWASKELICERLIRKSIRHDRAELSPMLFEVMIQVRPRREPGCKEGHPETIADFLKVEVHLDPIPSHVLLRDLAQ
jgi:hypothetical protein